MMVAIVTGSAKGLGREIALALADWGYMPIVHFNKSRDEAELVVSEVEKKGFKTKAYQANLLDEKDVEIMVKGIIDDFGKVDLLINNVGNFLYKEFNKTTNAEFRDMIESNIYPTLYFSRAVLRSMRKQKNGQIINIGAVGADRIVIRAKSTPYFIGKTGAFILTKLMAWEEAKHNIRINMVSPASLVEDIFKANDFPMGRSAKPKDVISAIKFLISPENSYINGANIEVAGATVPGIEK